MEFFDRAILYVAWLIEDLLGWLVLGAVAFFSLRHAIRSKTFDVHIEIGDVIREVNPTIVRLSAKPFEKWSDQDKADAAVATGRLHELAVMAREGMIQKNHVARVWGPLFVSSWKCLRPYIEEKRRLNGETKRWFQFWKTRAFSRYDLEWFISYTYWWYWRRFWIATELERPQRIKLHHLPRRS